MRYIEVVTMPCLVVAMTLMLIFIVPWCLLSENLDSRTRKIAAERLSYEHSPF